MENSNEECNADVTQCNDEKIECNTDVTQCNINVTQEIEQEKEEDIKEYKCIEKEEIKKVNFLKKLIKIFKK